MVVHCGATTGDLLLNGWATYRQLTEHYARLDISGLGQGLKNGQMSNLEDETLSGNTPRN